MSDGAVGFIGLGNIGRPMAQRLVEWPGGLWVYDIDAAATTALEGAGAKVASSPREVAEHAAILCVMVRDDAQVRAVLTGRDGVLASAAAGAVVVVHSTVHPDTVGELVTLAAPHGVRVVDAPVSGGAVGAEQGRLALMVGGDDDAVALCRPALDLMGDLVVHVGPPGSGTAMKLARNLMHFVAFTAAMEASALAQAAGVDLATLGQVVRHTDAITGGPGAILYRDTAGRLADDDPWVPILEHVRALGEKDLSFATELARRLEVNTPLATLALQRLGIGLGLEDEA